MTRGLHKSVDVVEYGICMARVVVTQQQDRQTLQRRLRFPSTKQISGQFWDSEEQLRIRPFGTPDCPVERV